MTDILNNSHVLILDIFLQFALFVFNIFLQLAIKVIKIILLVVASFSQRFASSDNRNKKMLVHKGIR